MRINDGRHSLRNKVLVTILHTRQSRFGNSSIVSLFVVLDNSHHLVGSTIFTSQEEFDVFGRLMSEPLERKDSISLSIRQLILQIGQLRRTDE